MRHRPRLGKVVGRGAAVAAVTGQPPLGRLDAEQAAEAGRYANGAAAVAARGQRTQPCRQRGRRAPAGAAGGPLDIPGITAGIAQLVLGRRGNAELRGIGLAQYDCPGLADPLHYNRVHFSGAVPEDRRTHGGVHVFGCFQVLYGDRDSVQRAQRIAPVHRFLGNASIGQSRIGSHRQIGVQFGILASSPMAGPRTPAA